MADDLKPIYLDAAGNVIFHNPLADTQGHAPAIIKPMASLPQEQQAAIQAMNLPVNGMNAPLIQAQPIPDGPTIQRGGAQLPMAPPRAPLPAVRDLGTIPPVNVGKLAMQVAQAKALRRGKR